MQVKTLYKKPDPAKQERLQKRLEMEAESKDCSRCGGSGMVTVYAPQYDGNPAVDVCDDRGEIVRLVASCAAYCGCGLGQWIRESHRADSRDVFARIPDYSDVVFKRSIYRLENPMDTDVLPDEIIPLRDWRKMVGEVVKTRPGPPTRKSIFGNKPRAIPPVDPSPVPETEEVPS